MVKYFYNNDVKIKERYSTPFERNITKLDPIKNTKSIMRSQSIKPKGSNMY